MINFYETLTEADALAIDDPRAVCLATDTQNIVMGGVVYIPSTNEQLNVIRSLENLAERVKKLEQDTDVTVLVAGNTASSNSTVGAGGTADDGGTDSTSATTGDNNSNIPTA